MDWNEFINELVFVKLNDGSCYSGKVIEVEESGGVFFLTMIDKYQEKVSFSTSTIFKIVKAGGSVR